MLRHMLRAKIHRAVVTDACLEYEGSLTVDEDLLDAAGILPYELVMVSNLNNGERFTTYAINGKTGIGRSRAQWSHCQKRRDRRSCHHFLL